MCTLLFEENQKKKKKSRLKQIQNFIAFDYDGFEEKWRTSHTFGCCLIINLYIMGLTIGNMIHQSRILYTEINTGKFKIYMKKKNEKTVVGEYHGVMSNSHVSILCFSHPLKRNETQWRLSMEEKTMKFTQVCDMFRHGRLYYRSYEEVVKLDSQEILTGESLCSIGSIFYL